MPLDELIERDPVVLALVPPRVGPAPSMDVVRRCAGWRRAVPTERARPRGDRPRGAAAAGPLGPGADGAGRPGSWAGGSSTSACCAATTTSATSTSTSSPPPSQRRMSFVHLGARSESTRPVAAGPLPPRRRRPGLGGARRSGVARRRRRRRTRRPSAPAAARPPARCTSPRPGRRGAARAACSWSATSTRGWPRSSPDSPAWSPRPGSPLSHLAILAREHGVATVVGLADATARFRSGDGRHRRRSARRSPSSSCQTESIGITSGVAA